MLGGLCGILKLKKKNLFNAGTLPVINLKNALSWNKEKSTVTEKKII